MNKCTKCGLPLDPGKEKAIKCPRCLTEIIIDSKKETALTLKTQKEDLIVTFPDKGGKIHRLQMITGQIKKLEKKKKNLMKQKKIGYDYRINKEININSGIFFFILLLCWFSIVFSLLIAELMDKTIFVITTLVGIIIWAVFRIYQPYKYSSGIKTSYMPDRVFYQIQKIERKINKLKEEKKEIKNKLDTRGGPEDDK